MMILRGSKEVVLNGLLICRKFVRSWNILHKLNAIFE